MGLKKDIVLDNGITLNYHRVVGVNSVTNVNTIIEIAGYVNEEKRLEEKQYLQSQLEEGHNEEIPVVNNIISSYTIELPFDKDMNVDSAYKYLVTLDKYKGSKKV
jgi:hypothetical protein